jgi:hypothetical protein
VTLATDNDKKDENQHNSSDVNMDTDVPQMVLEAHPDIMYDLKHRILLKKIQDVATKIWMMSFYTNQTNNILTRNISGLSRVEFQTL